MTLQERIDYLDRQFGFKEKPEGFDFAFNPERIAYRNEALRTHNRALYSNYLADHYPEVLEPEMQDYDSVKLKILNKEEAMLFFQSNGVNLLESDLSFKDSDAVFSMYIVDNQCILWCEKHANEGLLNVRTAPEEVLEQRDILIVDVSRVTEHAHAKKYVRHL